jgi:hypothetical protein
MSRRAFLDNTGKVAGGLAAASVLPFALRGAEHAAPAVVEHAIPAAAARQGTLAEWAAADNLAHLQAQRAVELIDGENAHLGQNYIYREAYTDQLNKTRQDPRFKDFESREDISARREKELEDLQRSYDKDIHDNTQWEDNHGDFWDDYYFKQQEIATLIISDIELNKIINNCKKLKII